MSWPYQTLDLELAAELFPATFKYFKDKDSHNSVVSEKKNENKYSFKRKYNPNNSNTSTCGKGQYKFVKLSRAFNRKSPYHFFLRRRKKLIFVDNSSLKLLPSCLPVTSCGVTGADGNTDRDFSSPCTSEAGMNNPRETICDFPLLKKSPDSLVDSSDQNQFTAENVGSQLRNNVNVWDINDDRQSKDIFIPHLRIDSDNDFLDSSCRAANQTHVSQNTLQNVDDNFLNMNEKNGTVSSSRSKQLVSNHIAQISDIGFCKSKEKITPHVNPNLSATNKNDLENEICENGLSKFKLSVSPSLICNRIQIVQNKSMISEKLGVAKSDFSSNVSSVSHTESRPFKITVQNKNSFSNFAEKPNSCDSVTQITESGACKNNDLIISNAQSDNKSNENQGKSNGNDLDIESVSYGCLSNVRFSEFSSSVRNPLHLSTDKLKLSTSYDVATINSSSNTSSVSLAEDRSLNIMQEKNDMFVGFTKESNESCKRKEQLISGCLSGNSNNQNQDKLNGNDLGKNVSDDCRSKVERAFHSPVRNTLPIAEDKILLSEIHPSCERTIASSNAPSVNVAEDRSLNIIQENNCMFSSFTEESHEPCKSKKQLISSVTPSNKNYHAKFNNNGLVTQNLSDERLSILKLSMLPSSPCNLLQIVQDKKSLDCSGEKTNASSISNTESSLSKKMNESKVIINDFDEESSSTCESKKRVIPSVAHCKKSDINHAESNVKDLVNKNASDSDLLKVELSLSPLSESNHLHVVKDKTVVPPHILVSKSSLSSNTTSGSNTECRSFKIVRVNKGLVSRNSEDIYNSCKLKGRIISSVTSDTKCVQNHAMSKCSNLDSKGVFDGSLSKNDLCMSPSTPCRPLHIDKTMIRTKLDVAKTSSSSTTTDSNTEASSFKIKHENKSLSSDVTVDLQNSCKSKEQISSNVIPDDKVNQANSKCKGNDLETKIICDNGLSKVEVPVFSVSVSNLLHIEKNKTVTRTQIDVENRNLIPNRCSESNTDGKLVKVLHENNSTFSDFIKESHESCMLKEPMLSNVRLFNRVNQNHAKASANDLGSHNVANPSSIEDKTVIHTQFNLTKTSFSSNDSSGSNTENRLLEITQGNKCILGRLSEVSDNLCKLKGQKNSNVTSDNNSNQNHSTCNLKNECVYDDDFSKKEMNVSAPSACMHSNINKTVFSKNIGVSKPSSTHVVSVSNTEGQSLKITNENKGVSSSFTEDLQSPCKSKQQIMLNIAPENKSFQSHAKCNGIDLDNKINCDGRLLKIEAPVCSLSASNPLHFEKAKTIIRRQLEVAKQRSDESSNPPSISNVECRLLETMHENMFSGCNEILECSRKSKKPLIPHFTTDKLFKQNHAESNVNNLKTKDACDTDLLKIDLPHFAPSICNLSYIAKDKIISDENHFLKATLPSNAFSVSNTEGTLEIIHKNKGVFSSFSEDSSNSCKSKEQIILNATLDNKSSQNTKSNGSVLESESISDVALSKMGIRASPSSVSRLPHVAKPKTEVYKQLSVTNTCSSPNSSSISSVEGRLKTVHENKDMLHSFDVDMQDACKSNEKMISSVTLVNTSNENHAESIGNLNTENVSGGDLSKTERFVSYSHLCNPLQIAKDETVIHTEVRVAKTSSSCNADSVSNTEGSSFRIIHENKDLQMFSKTTSHDSCKLREDIFSNASLENEGSESHAISNANHFKTENVSDSVFSKLGLRPSSVSNPLRTVKEKTLVSVANTTTSNTDSGSNSDTQIISKTTMNEPCKSREHSNLNVALDNKSFKSQAISNGNCLKTEIVSDSGLFKLGLRPSPVSNPLRIVKEKTVVSIANTTTSNVDSVSSTDTQIISKTDTQIIRKTTMNEPCKSREHSNLNVTLDNKSFKSHAISNGNCLKSENVSDDGLSKKGLGVSLIHNILQSANKKTLLSVAKSNSSSNADLICNTECRPFKVTHENKDVQIMRKFTVDDFFKSRQLIWNVALDDKNLKSHSICNDNHLKTENVCDGGLPQIGVGVPPQCNPLQIVKDETAKMSTSNADSVSNIEEKPFKSLHENKHTLSFAEHLHGPCKSREHMISNITLEQIENRNQVKSNDSVSGTKEIFNSGMSNMQLRLPPSAASNPLHILADNTAIQKEPSLAKTSLMTNASTVNIHTSEPFIVGKKGIFSGFSKKPHTCGRVVQISDIGFSKSKLLLIPSSKLYDKKKENQSESKGSNLKKVNDSNCGMFKMEHHMPFLSMSNSSVIVQDQSSVHKQTDAAKTKSSTAATYKSNIQGGPQVIMIRNKDMLSGFTNISGLQSGDFFIPIVDINSCKSRKGIVPITDLNRRGNENQSKYHGEDLAIQTTYDGELSKMQPNTPSSLVCNPLAIIPNTKVENERLDVAKAISSSKSSAARKTNKRSLKVLSENKDSGFTKISQFCDFFTEIVDSDSSKSKKQITIATLDEKNNQVRAKYTDDLEIADISSSSLAKKKKHCTSFHSTRNSLDIARDRRVNNQQLGLAEPKNTSSAFSTDNAKSKTLKISSPGEDKSTASQSSSFKNGKKSTEKKRGCPSNRRLTTNAELKAPISALTERKKCNPGVCKKPLSHKGTIFYYMLASCSEERYACEICNYEFSDSKNLVQHMKAHDYKICYACHICEKTFPFKCNLKKHMEVHLDKKPFECQVCGKPFAKRESVMRHMICHSSKKPFSCNMCEKQFVKKCNFINHIVSHFK